MDVAVLLVGLLISGFVGAAIGNTRENGGVGFALGLVLGPIGWILAFFADERPQCDECKSRVPTAATRCPHCGLVFDDEEEDEQQQVRPMKKCPFCAETIQAAAIKCRYCHSDIAHIAPANPLPAHIITCPLCAGILDATTLVAGANMCPKCNRVFNAQY